MLVLDSLSIYVHDWGTIQPSSLSGGGDVAAEVRADFDYGVWCQERECSYLSAAAGIFTGHLHA